MLEEIAEALLLDCFCSSIKLLPINFSVWWKFKGKKKNGIMINLALKMETHNFRFHEGAVHMCTGATGSGKTRRIREYLRHKNILFENGEQLYHVIFYYALWQREYDEIQREFEGTTLSIDWVNNPAPTNNEFEERASAHTRSINIIDDGMSKISEELLSIVTVTARHLKATTFLLFQSLFPPHRLARQISLNTKYFHIHKNPREQNQIQVLARQIQPRNNEYIVQAYEKATEEPYSIFLIDLMQTTPENYRFRSHILPRELPMVAYVSRKKKK